MVMATVTVTVTDMVTDMVTENTVTIKRKRKNGIFGVKRCERNKKRLKIMKKWNSNLR